MCIKICVLVTFLRGCVVFIITWVFCLFDWLMKTGSRSIPQVNLELTLFPLQAMNSQQSSFLSFLGVWLIVVTPSPGSESLLWQFARVLIVAKRLCLPGPWVTPLAFTHSAGVNILYHLSFSYWTVPCPSHRIISPPPPPGPKGEHSPGVSFAV